MYTKITMVTIKFVWRAARGGTWLSDALPQALSWLDDVEEELEQRVDAYLTQKENEGGIGGFFAGAVDFIGDDLLGLW